MRNNLYYNVLQIKITCFFAELSKIAQKARQMLHFVITKTLIYSGVQELWTIVKPQIISFCKL